jgi:hypothetical protein
MRGFTTGPIGALLNPSYLNYSKASSRLGNQWARRLSRMDARRRSGNSAAPCRRDQCNSLPRSRNPRPAVCLWVRYADWANNENFRSHSPKRIEVFEQSSERNIVILMMRSACTGAGLLPGGSGDLKGPAVSIEIIKAAQARRHVDCFV